MEQLQTESEVSARANAVYRDVFFLFRCFHRPPTPLCRLLLRATGEQERYRDGGGVEEVQALHEKENTKRASEQK